MELLILHTLLVLLAATGLLMIIGTFWVLWKYGREDK